MSAAAAGAGPDVFCRRVKIVNRRGLHARAAAKFVRIAEQFRADIKVANGGISVPGTSIMGLMMLAATTGSTLELTAIGEDAERALDELEQLVAEGFEEP
jgi:phosphocarrier protein